jgi:oxygen-independent coproporphyrinogen III oxidase
MLPLNDILGKKEIAGLYIHVPFCKNRCSYCDFYSQTNLKLMDEFVNALQNELILVSEKWHKQKFASIYFGGGNPGCLSIENIGKILKEIFEYLYILKDAEITIELNPETINYDYLTSLKKLGFNRISIGVQSFFNDLLISLGRKHSVKQAEEALEFAQNCGFENISIDLMFGIPNLSIKMWEETLEKVFNLGITHISAYLLSLEEGTELYNKVNSQALILPTDDIVCEQYRVLCDIAKNYNFEHYEISNFAKQDYKSIHNCLYWYGNPYLGLGPSAHSYNGIDIRSWNIRDLKKYIEGLKLNKIISEKEFLSETDKINDFIITRLRTVDGLSIKLFTKYFGDTYGNMLVSKLNQLVKTKMITIKNNRVQINEPDLIFSDKIIRDLMFI